jgi:hypothetical protein
MPIDAKYQAVRTLYQIGQGDCYDENDFMRRIQSSSQHLSRKDVERLNRIYDRVNAPERGSIGDRLMRTHERLRHKLEQRKSTSDSPPSPPCSRLERASRGP